MTKPPRRKRRKKRKPIEQGSLKKIVDYIIGPLVKLRPEEYNIKEWLNYIFNFETRKVDLYRSIKPFRLSGLELDHNCKLTRSVITRDIKPNTLFWVRIDETMPARIDVEFLYGRGKKAFLLQITDFQWLRIKGNFMHAG